MEQIENIALKDSIYERIKTMIDTGDLAMGQKINKLELAQQFNVSQTPINDALNRLVGENYIVQESRKGFFVKVFSVEEMAWLFELRAGLEGIAARLCCERASDEDIKNLSSLFDGFSLPFKTEDYKKYALVDKTFHKLLIQYANNPYITKTLETTGLLIKSNLKGLVRPPEETLGEHQQIIQAIIERDAEHAAQRIENHLLSSRNLLQDMMKKKLDLHH